MGELGEILLELLGWNVSPDKMEKNMTERQKFLLNSYGMSQEKLLLGCPKIGVQKLLQKFITL